MVKSLIIPVAFVLFSCDRYIDIEPVNDEQQLVVSAVIHPEEIDSLLLSSTYSTEGTTNINDDDGPGTGVSGATIVVIHQGDTIGKYVEKYKGSYYYEGENFQEKMEYSLSIRHPGFQDVSANTTVPVAPEVGFATHHVNGEKVKEIPEADLQVLLEFEDPADTRNFYMLTVSSTWENTHEVYDSDNHQMKDSIAIHTYSAQINSKSSIIEMSYSGSFYQFAQNNIDWESGYRVWERELIFSDKLFNGQKVTIPVDIKVFATKNIKQINLTLSSISEEYYQLLRSLAAYRKSERGFFPEALQVYSNVHNGQGVWAAKSSKTISLDISELDLFNYE